MNPNQADTANFKSLHLDSLQTRLLQSPSENGQVHLEVSRPETNVNIAQEEMLLQN